MWSRYQRELKGLCSGRTYTRFDVQRSQDKIKVLQKHLNGDCEHKKSIAVKHINREKHNIEFFCRMINQDVIENSI